MLLLAFGNKARNGKDTAAEAICDYYTRQYALKARVYGAASGASAAKIFRFAEALYEECRTMYGMKEKDAPLLQRIGQARRDEDPLYWVKICYSKILSSSVARNGIAIIPDLRYKNEAEFLKSKGGILINVKRLNEDGTQYIADDRDPSHPSEIELDGYNWDYYIVSKEAALTGDMAITIAEYLRGLR